MIRISSILGILLSVAFAAPATAQSTTPSEAYLAYRQGVIGATSVDDIIPFLSSASQEEIAATPEDQKGMMFDFMKMFEQEGKGLKITSETISGEEAKLVGELCLLDEMNNVNVDMVVEDGEWKVVAVAYNNQDFMVPDANDPNMMVPQKCE